MLSKYIYIYIYIIFVGHEGQFLSLVKLITWSALKDTKLFEIFVNPIGAIDTAFTFIVYVRERSKEKVKKKKNNKRIKTKKSNTS